jgi:hypothetical protein
MIKFISCIVAKAINLFMSLALHILIEESIHPHKIIGSIIKEPVMLKNII